LDALIDCLLWSKISLAEVRLLGVGAPNGRPFRLRLAGQRFASILSHSLRIANGEGVDWQKITGIVFAIDAIPIRSVNFVLIFLDLCPLFPSLSLGGVPIISSLTLGD
jgi:hypothetical protein